MELFVSIIIEQQKISSKYPYHLYEQKEIDAIIYQLYGLNDEDIREVELWYCRRYYKLAEAQGLVTEFSQKYADYLVLCEQGLEQLLGIRSSRQKQEIDESTTVLYEL